MPPYEAEWRHSASDIVYWVNEYVYVSTPDRGRILRTPRIGLLRKPR
jgi:hypothetical protein